MPTTKLDSRLMSGQSESETPYSRVAQTVVDSVANAHAHFAASVCQAFDFTENLFEDAQTALEVIVEGDVRVIVRDDHVVVFPSPLLSIGLFVFPAYARSILLDRMDDFPMDWTYTRGVDLGTAYVTVECRDILRRAICCRMCDLFLERCCSVDSQSTGLELCATFLGSLQCRAIVFEGFDELAARFQRVDKGDTVVVQSSDLLQMMLLRHKMQAGSQMLLLDGDKTVKVIATPESATRHAPVF